MDKTFKKDDVVRNVKISNPIRSLGQVVGPAGPDMILVKMINGFDEWNIEDIELVEKEGS